MQLSLRLLLCLWICLSSLGMVRAQQTTAYFEVQSQFIDITGLFGLNEISGLAHYTHQGKHFGFELYHSFSFEQPGRSIQSYASGRYAFKLEPSGRWGALVKLDLVYFRTAGGAAFYRPMTFLMYKPSPRHIVSLGNWVFVQSHDLPAAADGRIPKRLNGFTSVLSFKYITPPHLYQLTSETRLVWNDTFERTQVLGWVQQLKLSRAKLPIYLGLNTALPLYRKPGAIALTWSVFVGYAL